jgi:hypothetical protein
MILGVRSNRRPHSLLAPFVSPSSGTGGVAVGIRNGIGGSRLTSPTGADRGRSETPQAPLDSGTRSLV